VSLKLFIDKFLALKTIPIFTMVCQGSGEWGLVGREGEVWGPRGGRVKEVG
jgi:hypothetical protein